MLKEDRKIIDCHKNGRPIFMHNGCEHGKHPRNCFFYNKCLMNPQNQKKEEEKGKKK